MDDYLWIDGQLTPSKSIELPSAAPALHSGYGLFETMLMSSGRLLRWTYHLERLRAAAGRLGLVTIDPKEFTREVHESLVASGEQDGRVRLSLLALGPSGETTRVLSMKAGEVPPVSLDQTVREVEYYPPDRSIRGMKTTNYMPDLHGIRAAIADGDFDRIRTTETRQIAEGHRSNYFITPRPGRVITPTIEIGILPGVARRALIEQAGKEGMVIEQRDWIVTDLNEESGLVMSNSLRGALQVRHLHRKDSDVPVELLGSRELARILNRLLERDSEGSSLRIQ